MLNEWFPRLVTFFSEHHSWEWSSCANNTEKKLKSSLHLSRFLNCCHLLCAYPILLLQSEHSSQHCKRWWKGYLVKGAELFAIAGEGKHTTDTVHLTADLQAVVVPPLPRAGALTCPYHVAITALDAVIQTHKHQAFRKIAYSVNTPLQHTTPTFARVYTVLYGIKLVACPHLVCLAHSSSSCHWDTNLGRLNALALPTNQRRADQQR